MAGRGFYFTEFDGRLNHILGKLERDGKNEVVEELATEAEQDVLQELRERVFILAKDMYENALRDTGTINNEEKVDISLQRRTKSGENSTLAKDIVELYAYTVGLQESFPKDVLTRNCKLKEIKKKDDEAIGAKPNQAEEWSELFNGKNREVVHQRIFNTEIMNRMKDMEKRMETMAHASEDDKNKIEQLQSDLRAANQEIATLKAVLKVPEKKVNDANTSQEPPNNSENVIDNKDNNSAYPSLPPTRAGPSTSLLTGKASPMKKVGTPPQAQSQQNVMVTRVTESNGDFTTFLHKKGTEQSAPLEQYRRDQQEEASGDRPAPPGRHAGYQQRRQLRGVKRERGITMYLSGIEVDDESDEDIVHMIKEHAKDKGLRVMGHTIIRTWRYPYVVGCKIVIPENQEYISLNPDTWPADVSCRKWEKQQPRNQRRNDRNTNYKPNTRDGFWSDYEDNDNYYNKERDSEW